MGEGFCPYCAHQNPPDYVYCESCKRELPQDAAHRVEGAERPDHPEGAPPQDQTQTEAPELAPPRSFRWVLLILVVAVALVVVIAGLGVLTHVLVPGGSTNSGATTKVVVDDQCSRSSGIDCGGNSVSLPYDSSGVLLNTSGCSPIASSGSGDTVWFNATSDGKVHGAVIPQAFYNGQDVSFTVDPAGYFNNTSAVADSAWSSGMVDGPVTVSAALPSTTSSWCLAWWDPGPFASVTLDSDVVVLVPETS